jgi:hypothetical protein
VSVHYFDLGKYKMWKTSHTKEFNILCIIVVNMLRSGFNDDRRTGKETV